MTGYSYFNKDVAYVSFKKHDCPCCHHLLKTVKVSRVVNSRSPEAKDFNFRMGRSYMVGDVKFVWKEFECPECKKHFTVEELKRLEGIEESVEEKPAAQKQNAKGLALFLVIGIALLLIFALLRGGFHT